MPPYTNSPLPGPGPAGPPGGGSNIPWGPIIATGGQILGDYLGYKGQKEANAANAQQAKDRMDFERDMANTSFQRGRADLEAAGYNPALAYNKGGADSPSGAQADIKNALAAFGGSARAAVDTFNSIQQTQAGVAKTRADTKLTEAQANQLNLESAGRVAELQARASLTGTNARFANETFTDRASTISNNQLSTLYSQRLGQVNLERGLRGWERDRDVIWPLAVEQLRQNLTATIASTRNVNATARLSELAEPTAENMARMAKTAWGKNVSPFLSDANTIARMLSIGYLPQLIGK